MKKFSAFVSLLLLFSFVNPTGPLTEQERKTANEFLQKTEQGVFDAVKGLSDAQLNFKSAPDRWSVLECVKHIAITEQGLWQMTDASIKAAANPEKRSEIKATDEDVIKMIESREHKVKTYPQMEPQNTPFKTLDEALTSFKTNRDLLMEYVKKTDTDLRSHVATLPMGSFDTYQMILFIGAHSYRHTQQIAEVKADPNFPKN